MLEEISRKQFEAQQAQIEQRRRAAEAKKDQSGAAQ